MIQAMQISSRPALSSSARPPQIQHETQNRISLSKARSPQFITPDRVEASVAVASSPLKAEILKQILGQDRPIATKIEKITLSQLQPPPVSQAASIVLARADESSGPATPVDTAPHPALISRLSDSLGEASETSVGETAVFAKGVQYVGLDASWKIIPTARLVGENHLGGVDLSV